jgi:MarR family transcriptional regulator, negative regulator of the multidrug operon emrRAB
MLEANLQALRGRMPDLPLDALLLSRLLLHVGREFASLLEQQIRPFGLAEAEFWVLVTLFSQPEGVAHPSDLCAGARQRPANMSRIGDALVSRDLITRVLSAQDRRRVVITITEHGKELVRQLLSMAVPLRGMPKIFSEEEQLYLISQLKRLTLP